MYRQYTAPYFIETFICICISGQKRKPEQIDISDNAGRKLFPAMTPRRATDCRILKSDRFNLFSGKVALRLGTLV